MFTFATHLEVFGLCCICVVRNWFHVIAVTASVVTHSTNLGDTCSFSYCIDLLILLYVCDNDLVCVCVLILLCLYCFPSRMHGRAVGQYMAPSRCAISSLCHLIVLLPTRTALDNTMPV